MKKPILLIDADGVMLDYNLAFGEYYAKIFNVNLLLVNPKAYHEVNMWGIKSFSEEDKKKFYEESSRLGMWKNMPSIPGSVEFVNRLSEKFEVICLTSMPTIYEKDRLFNLQDKGFNIHKVIATSRISKENPKKKFVEELKPEFFIDDLLKNFEGINCSDTKLILLDNGYTENPNAKYSHVQYNHIISNYNEFFNLN